MIGDLGERIERLEEDVYSQEPERPGVILRIDRMERMLLILYRIATVIGGLAVTWRVFDVIAEILSRAG